MLLLAAQNKKGISLIIGYILLVAIAIVMSIIVFQWLKTYVPTETLECDDGTSLFISDVFYDCTSNILDISVNNNGKFSINGFYIRVTDDPDAELATIDLSSKIIDGGEEYGSTNSIEFGTENSLDPEEYTTSSFDVTDYNDALVKVEIIPTRIQEVDNKKRLVSCSEAKVEKILECE
ncbi:MAG: hypothetical protein M1416_02240 [Candidatus Pacearchaeota archaeon]|nr:hypothetical protein [Candidatus Pacearchaeota archaeon]